MPKILEIHTRDDDTLWVRIPSPLKETPVYLWTEDERKDALKAERERCMTAIRQLEPSSSGRVMTSTAVDTTHKKDGAFYDPYEPN